MNNFFAEDLITGFHIRQNGIVEDVRHQGQRFVRHHVPEHGHTVSPTEEARAVHNIRNAFFEGLEQFRVVTRIVLKISVLDQQNITLGSEHSRTDSSAFALIFLMQNDVQIFLTFKLFQDVTSAILRAVVHKHNLMDQIGSTDALNDRLNAFNFIINRDYD